MIPPRAFNLFTEREEYRRRDAEENAWKPHCPVTDDQRLEDWRLPTPQELKKDLMKEFTEEERSDMWTELAETVKTYHHELVARWKEEMDTLLVYAGLFSAILTAFNVQSYQLLKPDPLDPAVVILQQISRQLTSFSINPAFINSTHTAEPLADLQTSFRAPRAAVWINTLWFCSLVCSLASASIALIVKQWLHEAVSGLSGTSRESTRLRQHRLNGLLKWRVGTIVLAPPILLQVALALFLGGMLILLWTLHTTVAAVISSLVGVLCTFLMAVSMLPVFKWDCCYRSPLSFAAYTIIRFVGNFLRRLCDHLWDTLQRACRRSVSMRDRIDRYILPVVAWARYRFREMPTWNGRDQVSIARDTGKLDRCTFTTAYTTTLSPTYLDRMHIVLPDLPRDQLRPALEDIWQACEDHWGGRFGPGAAHWCQTLRRAEYSVLYAVRHMAAAPESTRDEQWRCDTKSIMDKLVSALAPDRADTAFFISTLSPLSFERHDVAWMASDKVISYWMLSKKAMVEVASYPVMRNVLAVSKWKLKVWKEEEYTFENFLGWMRTARAVLFCISRSLNNDVISPTQSDLIRRLAGDLLITFERLILEQDWKSFKPFSTDVNSGRRDMWPGIIQHRTSAVLFSWIIEPLTDIAGNNEVCKIIPPTLPMAIQQGWSALKRHFPLPLDMEVVDSIPLPTAVKTIDQGLVELSALVEGTQKAYWSKYNRHIDVVARSENPHWRIGPNDSMP
ncbi:hypothetical protein C8Q74DRAFT_1359163 [Fomes fomentarius]|nr:hypothetical protein C8Q74DRAFT_1359163 [Fomes fomentarius]